VNNEPASLQEFTPKLMKDRGHRRKEPLEVLEEKMTEIGARVVPIIRATAHLHSQKPLYNRPDAAQMPSGEGKAKPC